jgi:hypothetical protein
MVMNKESFFKRQAHLFKALNRTKALIKRYIPELTNWEDKYNWDFNLLHDLEERICERIIDLQCDYNQWHFNEYGWVAL